MTFGRKENNRSTSDIILDVLIKNGEPLNLYKLSKMSRLSHQRVKYTLTKLIKKGLILPVNTADGTRYAIQKIHVDDQLVKSVLNSIEPLIQMIHNYLSLEYAEDIEEALANNVALFISKRVNAR